MQTSGLLFSICFRIYHVSAETYQFVINIYIHTYVDIPDYGVIVLVLSIGFAVIGIPAYLPNYLPQGKHRT